MKYIAMTLSALFSICLFAQPQPPAHAGWDFFVNRFDTNKDGLISLEEMNAVQKSHFLSMDANNDGLISEDEFNPQGMMGKHRQGGGPPWLKADANQDHSISQDEWTAYVNSLELDENGGVSLGTTSGLKRDPMGRHANLDKNQNGIIEREEFAALFQVLDTNEDGILDQKDHRWGNQAGKRGQRDFAQKGFPFLRAADANQDQVLTADEWTQFLDSHKTESGGINLSEVPQCQFKDNMLQCLDRNQNGQIDLDEIQVVFDHMDRNQDGQITAEDRPIQRAKRHCNRRM